MKFLNFVLKGVFLLSLQQGCSSKSDIIRQNSDSLEGKSENFESLAQMSFRNYFDFWNQKGWITLQRFSQSHLESGALINLSKSTIWKTQEPHSDSIKKLYLNYLKSLGPAFSNSEFKIWELPQKSIVLSPNLGSNFYNSNLISVGYPDSPTAVFFRPIKTVTGCQSSCKKIVFHLVLKKIGNEISLEEILEEPEFPLTKIGHQAWTPEEKISFIKISKDSLKILGRLQHPSQTTTQGPGFREQTWTLLKPFVVPGAAYSSYRIIEAYQKTLDFLNGNKASQEFSESANSIMWEIIENPRSQNLAQSLIEKISLKPLAPESTEGLKVLVLREIWLSRIQGFKNINFLNSLFQVNDKIGVLGLGCFLIKESLPNSRTHPSLARFLVQQGKGESLCLNYSNQFLLDILALLSDPLSKQLSAANRVAQTENPGADLFLEPEFLFAFWVSKDTQGKLSSLRKKQILIDFKTRFPHASPTLFEHLQKRFSSSDSLIPNQSDSVWNPPRALDLLDTDKKIIFPVNSVVVSSFSNEPKVKKRLFSKDQNIFVLFSRSCHLCIDLLNNYYRFENLGESLTVNWIEIDQTFGATQTKEIQEFCNAALVSLEKCNQWQPQFFGLQVKGQRLWQNFLDQIDFQGTPHIFITNERGEVIVPRISANSFARESPLTPNPSNFFLNLKRSL